VIKFVSDLWQVGGSLQVLWFPPPIKADRHDITEILLKVALNTINLIRNFVGKGIIIGTSGHDGTIISSSLHVVGQ
jgi:hypothetical protein